jgi:5-methylcytosine-specific restriction protein A
MPTSTPNREDVMKAVAEFDRFGRGAFLDRYGFGKARDYLLIVDGREYDSKAIWGAAHQYSEGGRALRSDEFSGGKSAAVSELRRLGFEVSSPAQNPDWTWDEHVLALELYITNREHLPGKTHPKVLALSDLLNRLGERKGLRNTSTFRNANGVSMKIQNFKRWDPLYQDQGLSGLKGGSGGEQPVWAKYSADPAELTVAASVIRLAIEDLEVDLIRLDDEDEDAEEGALKLRVHYARERIPKLAAKKKAQVLERHGALRCEVCAFDFRAVYGALGNGYIEAHHTRPVAKLTAGERTKVSDLALVCANCHRMLHRQDDPADIAGLRLALNNAPIVPV